MLDAIESLVREPLVALAERIRRPSRRSLSLRRAITKSEGTSNDDAADQDEQSSSPINTAATRRGRPTQGRIRVEDLAVRNRLDDLATFETEQFAKEVRYRTALILLLIMNIGFAGWDQIAKKSRVPEVALPFLLWRQTLTAFILLLYWRVRRRGDLRMPSPEQRILVIGYGACYFFVAPLCFLGGLWNSNPSAASIVGPLSPLATFALAVALGRERATRRKVLGMLLAISGAIAIIVATRLVAVGGGGGGGGGGGETGGAIAAQDGHPGDETFLKTLEMLTTGEGSWRNAAQQWQTTVVAVCCFVIEDLCFAVGILLQKQIYHEAPDTPPLLVTTWGYVCGAAMLFSANTVYAVFVSGVAVVPLNLPARVMPALAYCVVVASIINYNIHNYAISVMPVVAVAMAECFEPGAGLILEYLIDGQPITQLHVAGIVAVASGLAVYLGLCGLPAWAGVGPAGRRARRRWASTARGWLGAAGIVGVSMVTIAWYRRRLPALRGTSTMMSVAATVANATSTHK